MWLHRRAHHNDDGSSEPLFRSSLKFIFSEPHASAKLPEGYCGSQDVYMLDALLPAALHTIYQRQMRETTSSLPIPSSTSAYHSLSAEKLYKERSRALTHTSFVASHAAVVLNGLCSEAVALIGEVVAVRWYFLRDVLCPTADVCGKGQKTCLVGNGGHVCFSKCR